MYWQGIKKIKTLNSKNSLFGMLFDAVKQSTVFGHLVKICRDSTHTIITQGKREVIPTNKSDGAGINRIFQTYQNIPWKLNEQKQFYDSFHTGTETFKLMEHDTVLTSRAGPPHWGFTTLPPMVKDIYASIIGKEMIKKESYILKKEKEVSCGWKLCLLLQNKTS